jgi:hypothetical protein
VIYIGTFDVAIMSRGMSYKTTTELLFDGLQDGTLILNPDKEEESKRIIAHLKRIAEAAKKQCDREKRPYPPQLQAAIEYLAER